MDPDKRFYLRLGAVIFTSLAAVAAFVFLLLRWQTVCTFFEQR